MTNQPTNIRTRETRRRRDALEAKLRELSGTPADRETLWIENDADPLDRVTSTFHRDIAISRFDQQALLCRDIRSALHKMEEGTYGSCENCEEEIPSKRLDAVPWAHLCIACQKEAEAPVRVGGSDVKEAA